MQDLTSFLPRLMLNCDTPFFTSHRAGSTGMSQHAWLTILFFKDISLCYFRIHMFTSDFYKYLHKYHKVLVSMKSSKQNQILDWHSNIVNVIGNRRVNCMTKWRMAILFSRTAVVFVWLRVFYLLHFVWFHASRSRKGLCSR
jgi:hypothetical protein